MREIKIRFGCCWVEILADLSVIELAQFLAGVQLKIRWNNTLQDCTGQKGFIEVYRTNR